MAEAPTLKDTMERVQGELEQDGKSRVHIKDEASGSVTIAESILRTAGSLAGLKVKTTTNAKSVTGKVAKEEDESKS